MTYREGPRPTRLVIAMNGEIAAVDRRSGEELWRASIHGAGLGPVALLLRDGAVYAASEEERVVCLDAATGRKVWEKATASYGRASLLVDGDELFVARGSHLECLDRASGERRWTKTLRGMGKGDAALALADE